MKSFATLISVLVASATAHADPTAVAAAPFEPSLVAAPGMVPGVPEHATEPRMFVAAGAAFGGDRGGIYLDPSLEVGYRLEHSNVLWAHAKLVGGNNFGLDESTYAGSRISGSAGIEARPCMLDGRVCGVAGVDLGVRHSYLDAEYDHYNNTDGILTERIGLDVGSKHLRFRPGIEVDESTNRALDGLAMTAGIAYAW